MLSSFDRDPSERACFTQRWAKLAHRLADCSASMSDGSDSDRDNEPLSALTVKQGKGKSKIVVDSTYDKAVKKTVLQKTNEDIMYERLYKTESQLVDAFFRLDQLIPGQIASVQAKVLHLGVPGRKLLPVGRAAIMIADNVGELHKVSGTSHRAVVQVPEAAPKCNRV